MLKKICIYEAIEDIIESEAMRDEVIFTLRKRLTKKEFKILKFGCDSNMEISDILDRLKLDEERYTLLLNSALSKIDKFKLA